MFREEPITGFSKVLQLTIGNFQEKKAQLPGFSEF